MVANVTHKFVSAKADGSDASLVKPSDWNDDHDVTAAGSDTQVQFNDNGAFEGDAEFAFNKATKTVTLPGGATVTKVSGATTDTYLFFPNDHRLYVQNPANYSAIYFGDVTFPGLLLSSSDVSDVYGGEIQLTFQSTAKLSPPLTFAHGGIFLNDYNTESHGIAVDGETGEVFMDSLILVGASTKSSASSAGKTGQLAWDADFLYVCTAGGTAGNATWKKTALSAAA